MADESAALLEAKEYALLGRDQARHVFPLRRLRRDWGMLFCETRDGGHWTLLGSYEWVESLMAQQGDVPEGAARAPSPSGATSSGKGVGPPVLAEWPTSDFAAKWLIRGWPDDWQGLGEIRVCRYPSAAARHELEGGDDASC
jgi:hypothetical protein